MPVISYFFFKSWASTVPCCTASQSPWHSFMYPIISSADLSLDTNTTSTPSPAPTRSCTNTRIIITISEHQAYAVELCQHGGEEAAGRAPVSREVEGDDLLLLQGGVGADHLLVLPEQLLTCEGVHAATAELLLYTGDGKKGESCKKGKQEIV